jgi:hypothetical protein
MGVRTLWMNDEKTILGYVFEGNWAWDEMCEAIRLADEYMDSVSHKVDFIVDSRNGGLIPSDVISHIQEVAVSRPPHQNYGGITVFVGANSLVRTLMTMASNIYRQLKQFHTFMFAATMEEAYTLIYEVQAQRQKA